MSDETSGALASALVNALAELTVVEAQRTATIPTKTGGSYAYKYADIGDVVKLTRPVLAAHGIVALTPVIDHGDGLACMVTLLHSSGDRLDLGPFPFPHGRDAQSTGSMVTYHRRYALVAALGMAAGDDDDGATAKPREREDAPAGNVAPRRGGPPVCEACGEVIVGKVKVRPGGTFVHDPLDCVPEGKPDEEPF